MEKGSLYIVATPIGNLEDITYRAVRILKSVDVIACEDTRVTSNLLSKLEISQRLVSYHEHNKEASAKNIIKMINEGSSIALVTDAGTPCVSDPGFYLIRLARKEGIDITSLPGPSACINALCVSGFATDRFIFEGFLTGSDNKKRLRLKELANLEITFIVYESPYRILKLLDMLNSINENLEVFCAREMTKKFEEFVTGTPKELIKHFESGILKGEFVVIVNKAQIEGLEIDDEEIFENYQKKMDKGIQKKEAMKQTAKRYSISKRDVYDIVLRKNK